MKKNMMTKLLEGQPFNLFDEFSVAKVFFCDRYSPQLREIGRKHIVKRLDADTARALL